MHNKIAKQNIALNCCTNNSDYNCYDLEKNRKTIFLFGNYTFEILLVVVGFMQDRKPKCKGTVYLGVNSEEKK